MSEKKTTSIDGMWKEADDGLATLLEDNGGGVFTIDSYFMPGPNRDGMRARFRITVEILDGEDAESDRAAEWDKIYGHAK